MEMDWSDTGTDFTSFGSYDPSAYDMASYDPAPIAAPTYASVAPDASLGNAPGIQSYSNMNQAYSASPQWWNPGGIFGENIVTPSDANPAPGTGGGTGAGGGGGAGGGLFGGVGGAGGLGTPSLLGLLGGGAGLLGALIAGGKTGSSTPIMSTPMRAAANQSYDAAQGLSQFAQNQSPLQQQQAQALNALFTGQISPLYQPLIEQAYGPAWQSAAQASIEGGRNAGFYDNPLSSPVGGAIMGPAAAALKGQEANSLLGLAQSVPGQFQAPINAQIGAQQNQAQAFNNLFNAYPYGQQNSVPLASQVGQGAAGTLMGLGQGMQQNASQVAQNAWQQQMFQQQQQANNQMRQLVAQSALNQGPIQTGLSGQTQGGQQQPYGGYDFSATYGGPSGGNG
jgi:hypothetical protein